MRDITSEAVGKWHGIYAALGIDVGDGKHCACPICGGATRFRMDNKDGRGTWICTHDGAGDGFKLLQEVLGIDFKQAIKEVSSIIGTVTEHSNIPKEKQISAETLRKIFIESKPANKNCQVGSYLENRGLKVIPSCLRLHPKCYEPETKKHHHAMLAVFTSQDGEALTMHRTFLDGHGGKAKITSAKKILPGLKKLSGGAIRLFEKESGMIAIAEGIETAIAVRELMNIPCWSVVSTALMEAFEPPKGITNVQIMADNDKNFAGQKSAFTLAHKLSLKGYEVGVMVPDKIGYDWLDVLNDKV